MVEVSWKFREFPAHYANEIAMFERDTSNHYPFNANPSEMLFA